MLSTTGNSPEKTHSAESEAAGLEGLIQQISKTIHQDPKSALEAMRAAEPQLKDVTDPDQRAHYCKLRAQAHAMLDDMGSAEDWALRANALFKEAGNRRGEAAVLNTLGIIASARSEYASAIRYQSETLQISQDLGFHSAVGHAANNIGLAYSYLGDLEKALQFFSTSLDAWKLADDQVGRANALLNLGFVHNQIGHFDQALEQYRRAEVEFSSGNLGRGLALTWRNMATSLMGKQRIEDAQEYAEKALQLARSLGDSGVLAKVLDGCVDPLVALGRTDDARELLSEAADIFKRNGNMRGQVISLSKSAKLPPMDPQVAKSLLHEAMELADRTGLRNELASCHLDLAEICKANGDWQQAYQHLEKHHFIEREVYTLKADELARTLKLTHDVEQAKREMEIERLRSVELASALREAEHQREIADELSRQMSEILRIAAHDLRNHTSSVLGCATVAMDLVPADAHPDLLELLRQLCIAGETLQDTLEMILDASAIESGTINLKSEPVELESFVQEVVDAWTSPAQTKGQRLEASLQVSPVVTYTDRFRIREIIDNLMSNAIKYSPRDSVLQIIFKVDDGQAKLSVCDQGPGISEEEQEKLFRAFQRLSPRPTAGEASIGLGLYIVKKLAGLLGGDVCYSDNPAGGSCFSLYLPLRVEAETCSPAVNYQV